MFKRFYVFLIYTRVTQSVTLIVYDYCLKLNQKNKLCEMETDKHQEDLANYDRQVECTYKDEQYSVRDNGSVYRHEREGKRKRKYDNIWTFGKPNANGYMLISGEVVHRIVAMAFHGDPPNSQYIVDHIDTNRQNNRPENLRWLTKLENILNNPITRKKVEFICGSVEAFLKDPSLLRNHESEDFNFSWMRRVTKEEARVSLERMNQWANSKSKNSKSKGDGLGEWIFEGNIRKSLSQGYAESDAKSSNYVESKTPNAIQKNWKTESEFPLCPSEANKVGLDKYLQNLKPGEIFTRNTYGESIVHSAEYLEDQQALLVLSENPGGAKQWAMAKIYLEDQNFVHESMGTFFSLEGAQKQFTLSCGRKWLGGDSIDDYT